MVTVLILFTTSNYPDCSLPSYAYSRPTVVYFIFFLALGLFVLLNLLLATFYNNYK